MLIRKLLLFVFFIAFISSCDKKTGEGTSGNNDSIPPQLAELNEKIEDEPSNAANYHERAKYFFERRNFKSAIPDAEKALQLDSSKIDYYLSLSDIYFTSNRTRLSKETLEKGVKKFPNNTDALLKLAELMLYVKQHEESIKYINQALKQDQYIAKAYFMKGMNFKEMGDTASAISSMETAVEQDQQYYAAYVQLGLLYAAKKNPLSLDYYNNALKLKPNSKEVLYNIGKFHQDNKKYDKAIDAYNYLLKVDSTYKHAHFNLGVINLAYLNKPEEAIKHFTNATRVDDHYAEAFFGRGTAFELEGYPKQAEDDYVTALLINPDYEPARESLDKLRATFRKKK